MKTTFLLSLTIVNLLWTFRVPAQETPKALAKVHYTFIHVNDTTQRSKSLRDEVVTYLGTASSYYTSYSKTRAQEEIERQMSDPGFDGNLTITRSTTGIPNSYLFNEQTLTEVVSLGGDEFVLEDRYPVLDWSIGDEMKTIGGYSCQKANVTFKGRAYTAWFTSELPFSAGPWKFHGLPGLILEVVDANKEVQWIYSGFDTLDKSAIALAPSEKAKPTTRKELSKLQEAFQANPQAYMEAKSRISASVPATSPGAGGRATITIRTTGTSMGGSSASSIDASRIKSVNVKNAENYAPSKTTNNPVELIP
ncbi:GLPGLI family protein [Sphingobacterium griseoflavum]|uniref:GLPGLI family protein n=1 Tax=Sphingobacterium griseoflavum TaxID=1474952 RepID=A0ABQ3HTX4_9SPHI|nr:GLPGLI family protein [Sphingobacterium griseoflavum]GHE28564.1 hypothetical protein GCM10017764_08790 [Sphingobacterium griseoflavum]